MNFQFSLYKIYSYGKMRKYVHIFYLRILKLTPETKLSTSKFNFCNGKPVKPGREFMMRSTFKTITFRLLTRNKNNKSSCSSTNGR